MSKAAVRVSLGTLQTIFALFCLSFASAQEPVTDNFAVEMDVVYAVVDGHELKLDIAVPRALAAPAPAIVDIQGGAWRRIQNTVEDAKLWAGYGFVGVSITHRTSDIAVFPAAVHDCKAVVRWLRANAKKYNIDPNRIGVTGFSSGGHLAALLGTSGGDGFLEGSEGNLGYSSRVQAVVDHFGPTDFMRMNDGKQVAGAMDHFAPDSPESLFLGGPLKERADLARLANPLTYIDAGDPPTLIAHGEKDRLVPIEQSEILYEALRKAGVPAEFVRVKNADHMYRPYPEGVKVSMDVDELNKMSAAWFLRWLGVPKLKSPGDAPAPSAVDPALKTNLYYKLTIDLPGRTAKSYVKGTFWVRCGDRELASGAIDLSDLSSEAGRTFMREFTAAGVDFTSCELIWNFSGEIYDSELNEKLPLMMRQIAKYNERVEGVGFHFQIGAAGSPDIRKMVYLKNVPMPTGPYLGQKPPGDKPEIFAPGIVSTAGHEFGSSFSPDGRYLFFSRNMDIYWADARVIEDMKPAELKAGSSARPEGTVPLDGRGGGVIAFYSERRDTHRDADIYIMNADGSAEANLTKNGAEDLAPDWSAEGAKIVYCAFPDGNWDVFMMNADGSGQARITNTPESEEWAYLSPDAARITYASGGFPNYDIYVMNSDGSRPRPLVTLPNTQAMPKWSRDGKTIAHNYGIFFPEKSYPDNFTGDIYLVDADGTNSRKITDSGGKGINENPYWSPDGRRLVFQSNRNGNFQIYRMNADGGDQRRLTRHGGNDYWPCWSKYGETKRSSGGNPKSCPGPWPSMPPCSGPTNRAARENSSAARMIKTGIYSWMVIPTEVLLNDISEDCQG